MSDMPELNGFDTCRQIRRLPAHRDTPIVMVTGHEDTESINRAYGSGATDFISKPINWSLLGHRVRYLLRTSQVSQGLRESEARNRAFIRAIPDAILVIDKEGRVVEQVGGLDQKTFSVDDLPAELDGYLASAGSTCRSVRPSPEQRVQQGRRRSPGIL